MVSKMKQNKTDPKNGLTRGHIPKWKGDAGTDQGLWGRRRSGSFRAMLSGALGAEA